MQLQTYFKIIWRRGWIMVLLAVLTAAAAFGFSLIIKQRAPIYKSTIKILVQPARTDWGQAQAAGRLLSTYEAWLDSDYRSADVISALNLDMTPDQLRQNVRIASNLDQLVLTIEADNPDGELANKIVWEWANLFLSWRDQQNQYVQLQDRIDAEILDNPRYALERPKTTINTLAGGMFGFMVGLAIVFVLEYIESGIIRSAEDVDRFLAIPVVGAIPPVEG